MKNLILTALLISVAVVGLPLWAGAHTGGDSSVGTHMDSTRDSTAGEVTAEEFAEMEEVMVKMMNGQKLTDAEAQEMAEFMADHHGGFYPMGMMPGYGGYDGAYQGHMMDGWSAFSASYMSWLDVSLAVVWLLAGLLLVALLARKLSRAYSKNSSSS